VALQAPEGLKRTLPRLADDLRRRGYSVIISGDPCYGACDLDLAARDRADILIHIGHTPVDNTERVIYEPWLVDGDLTVITRVIPHLREKRLGWSPQSSISISSKKQYASSEMPELSRSSKALLLAPHAQARFSDAHLMLRKPPKLLR
jgi:diphthamide biosynthesis enzyme Dph1/Dph2-like protein